MFELTLSNVAAKFYNTANVKLAGKLNLVFKSISDNPYYGPNIKKLRGKFEGLFRYRLGNIRIVYSIEKEIKIVAIIWIGKRKDAYK